MDLKTLISKLSAPCRKALESAAQLCVSQTHFNVEVEHFLLKLLEAGLAHQHNGVIAFSQRRAT